MKKIKLFFMTNIFCMLFTMTAFAGTWKNDQQGWWYQKETGSYPSSTWQKIDDKWYYFDEEGYMQTGWIQSGDKWYYCGLNGRLVTDQWINGTYYVGSDGVMYVNTTTPDGQKVGADGAKENKRIDSEKQVKISGIFRDENIERDQWWAINREKVANDKRLGGSAAEVSEAMARYYPDCPGEDYTEITIDGNEWSEYYDTGYRGGVSDSGTIVWSGDGKGVMMGSGSTYSLVIINNDIIEVDGYRFIRE